MFKHLIAAFFLCACGASAFANDYVTSGQIAAVRIHTAKNGTTSVRGVTAFKLTAQLAGNCQWLAIAAEDKTTPAHFLTAQALGNSIYVYYADNPTPPWGDTQSCWVTVIDK